MIRILMAFPVLTVVLAFVAIYSAYGEIEPCRVLAVEQARRTSAAVGGLAPGGLLERWSRLTTSQMTMGECVSDLMDSWGERVSGKADGAINE